MNTPAAIAAVALLCLAPPLFAARPLLTNDPEPVSQGKLQIELGAAYAQNGREVDLSAPLTLTYGILPNLETGIGFGGQFKSGEADPDEPGDVAGVSDLTLNAKYKLLDQKKFFFSQALAASLKIPTADHDEGLGSGKPDFDLTWIASRQIDEKLAAYLNIGYTWIGRNGDEANSDIFHYSLAASYQLTAQFQPVAEILFQTPAQHGKSSAGANVGIRWILSDKLTLDAAVGTRVAGDWPDLTATLGLTLVF